MERGLDIVIFGATGFTGRLVAEYLVEHHSGDLRLAIAGRNAAKLAQVKDELLRDRRGLSLEVRVADSADRNAMLALARETKVICTTVGPYAKYGSALVDACAETGTNYCDLTGETTFIRQSIDQHHVRARENRARIVHCAGFDSIPSDLGVFMLHDYFHKRGKRLRSADAFYGPVTGTFSGGTIASTLEVMRALSKSRDIRLLVTDPYALAPDRSTDRGADGPDQVGVRFEPRLEQWTGPFFMAGINTRVVRRSNALLDYAYGKDFRYTESGCFGRGLKGWSEAAGVSAGLIATAGVGYFGPGRALLERLGPKPGEGPSKAVRERSRFELLILGEGDGLRADAHVAGRDPGYGETAKMLSESAVCLVKDIDQLAPRFGVMTPAAALGTTLLQRLRSAGMTFEVRPHGAELPPAARRTPEAEARSVQN
jgi:short subunit dehydrogenase-like uncharacterized protein